MADHRSHNFDRIFAQEQLILAATEAVASAMTDLGVRRADLARRLGVSRAEVTQILSGERNMTLRSLSNILYALGLKAKITLSQERDEYRFDYSKSRPNRFAQRTKRHASPSSR